MDQQWIKLLFTYGPFALLVLFIFVIEVRTRALLYGAAKKPIGATIYVLTWITIFVLVGIVVSVWLKNNTVEREFYIRGRLIGLDSPNKLSSPFEDLYLRRVFANGTHFDFQWRIITKSKLDTDTVVSLYLDRGNESHEIVDIFQLPIIPDYYNREVLLLYHSATNEITADGQPLKKLPTVRLEQDSTNVFQFAGMMWRLFPPLVARALAQTFPSGNMTKRLEADDPVIRIQARDDLAASGLAAKTYVDEALSDMNSSYRLRLGVIIALNKMKTPFPGNALSPAANCSIRQAVVSDDVLLREQASEYIVSHPQMPLPVNCRSDSANPGDKDVALPGTPANSVLGFIGKGKLRNNDWYTFEVATKTKKLILSDQSPCCSPILSSDGRHIVFEKTASLHSLGLYIRDEQGERKIPGSEGELFFSLSVSHDASVVSYVPPNPGKRRDIYISHLAGKPKKIEHLKNSSFASAGVSPDGKVLAAFEQIDATDGQTLSVISVRDGSAKRIGEFTGVGRGYETSQPVWSPDGKTIAFIKDNAIFGVSPDGSDVRKLIASPGRLGGALAWSPDGRRIAFDVSLNRQTSIYAADLTNGDLETLTEGSHPSWAARFSVR